ncbi:sensor histidine kinase [Natronosporangium hydrolyticum]|uniref:sensor histidine kinase n=1 Tax=Natronosporangium hydrolyticum TaxID=2811111 RepID=UPI001EFA2AC3|nr:histidine kinase [Natronosporangium hydrolyticum]
MLLVTVAPVLAGLVGLLLLMTVVLLASPALVWLTDGPVSLGTTEVTTVAGTWPYVVGGVIALPLLGYLAAGVAGVHGLVARALLTGGADAGLRHELVEVTQSRARIVDAFEAERRRIERDLHDGAQQRLVGLTLQLGLAKLDLPPDTPAAESVASAHEQAKHLMVELRELIRGIYPKELADLGLPAALDAVADGAPIPVTIATTLPSRPPRPVEEAAYFTVTEALSNVIKHSGAGRAEVSVRLAAGLLSVEVTDHGNGGADPSRGTGLTGLADRAATLGGRMFLASPVGGPTTIRAEFPCPPSLG